MESKGQEGNAASLVRTYVDAVGDNAKSPYPSWSLAALFLFSAPFGFGQALLPTEAPTTAPARSGRPGGALLPASSGIRALPPFWQLAGFAVFYAGGGYMIKEGDSLNGSGTITAWSLTYLFFHGRAALRAPRHPAPLILATATATLGAGVHGSHYFTRSNWRSAARTDKKTMTDAAVHEA